jgi:hypothetical protein
MGKTIDAECAKLLLIIFDAAKRFRADLVTTTLELARCKAIIGTQEAVIAAQQLEIERLEGRAPGAKRARTSE